MVRVPPPPKSIIIWLSIIIAMFALAKTMDEHFPPHPNDPPREVK